MAISREEPLTLTGLARAERVRARRTTGNFFQVLGVQPRLGRWFADADDRPASDPVVIVSDEFWRTHLGADAGAVGTQVVLDARSHTIIGVLPAGFRYLRPYDVFITIGSDRRRSIAERPRQPSRVQRVARLRPGVNARGGGPRDGGDRRGLDARAPRYQQRNHVRAEPLAARLVSQVRLTLLVLFGAVGCLLLVACVNVANLLIARGAARQHELAVRAALGGGRLRLASQLLAESTLVSAAGGVLGIALASWLLRVLIAVAPEGTPRLDEVQVDAIAYLFALAAAAVSGLSSAPFRHFKRPAFAVNRRSRAGAPRVRRRAHIACAAV